MLSHPRPATSAVRKRTDFALLLPCAPYLNDFPHPLRRGHTAIATRRLQQIIKPKSAVKTLPPEPPQYHTIQKHSCSSHHIQKYGIYDETTVALATESPARRVKLLWQCFHRGAAANSDCHGMRRHMGRILRQSVFVARDSGHVECRSQS